MASRAVIRATRLWSIVARHFPINEHRVALIRIGIDVHARGEAAVDPLIGTAMLPPTAGAAG